MTFHLGAGSLTNLEGVHDDLIRVVHRAIRMTTVDFSVTEGLRSKEDQMALFQSGASRIMNSRHLTGHAIDLAPWVAGRTRWDWPLFFPIANAMKMASLEENVLIRWGGDWDGDGDTEDETFKDGPHFELPRQLYPA